MIHMAELSFFTISVIGEKNLLLYQIFTLKVGRVVQFLVA